MFTRSKRNIIFVFQIIIIRRLYLTCLLYILYYLKKNKKEIIVSYTSEACIRVCIIKLFHPLLPSEDITRLDDSAAVILTFR